MDLSKLTCENGWHFVGNHGVACYRCGKFLYEILEEKEVSKKKQIEEGK